MNTQGLLITSLSKKIPLIKAVRDATERLGFFKEIHGCDIDSQCLGQYSVDHFWHVSPLSEMCPELFCSYCHEQRIGAILPTREEDLLFFATHRQFFKERDIDIMVSPFESVNLCLDKLRWADFLTERGFPVIASYIDCEACEGDLFVVKERWSYQGREVKTALTREEARTQSVHYKAPLFQRYYKGREWSVDVYCTKESKVKGVVARLRTKVVHGESQITETLGNDDLEKLVREMAECLNLVGPSVFQIIEDDKGNFHVIECNPRFGGASTASIAVGLDSFFWFLTECLNLPLPPFIRNQKEIKQVRMPCDHIFWVSHE